MAYKNASGDLVNAAKDKLKTQLKMSYHCVGFWSAGNAARIFRVVPQEAMEENTTIIIARAVVKRDSRHQKLMSYSSSF